MEKTVGIFEAKTHLSELVERAEKGEGTLITRRGKPVARLVPAQQKVDTKAVQRIIARMRKRAKTTGIKRFDWKEWKQYVNEGRP
jgi:prevent-host-death family protein